MYILVNKKVMNVLNLNVSDIHKFDKESIIEIYKYVHTSCSSHDPYHFKFIYNYALSEKWFRKNTSYNEYDKEYQRTNYVYGFEDVREGYFFTVEDNRYIICSKLYETEKEAEDARDVLLTKANRIIARLYKVEI